MFSQHLKADIKIVATSSEDLFLFFGPHLDIDRKIVPILKVKPPFFSWSSTEFGLKKAPSLQISGYVLGRRKCALHSFPTWAKSHKI